MRRKTQCNMVGSNALPMTMLRPLLAAALLTAAAATHAQSPTGAGATPAGPPPLGPYEALVPTPDQSDATRDAALRHAMELVIERHAGYGSAASHSLRPLVDQVQQYVLSYGFEVDAGSTPPQTRLRARFDGNAVNSALVAAGLIAPQQRRRIDIEVAGIASLAAYQRVAAHLRSLAGVHAAAPVAGHGDVVRFELQVAGDARSVEMALSSGGLLRQSRYAAGGQPAQYVIGY